MKIKRIPYNPDEHIELLKYNTFLERENKSIITDDKLKYFKLMSYSLHVQSYLHCDYFQLCFSKLKRNGISF